MSKFNFEESENYGGGKNNFFSLKDDKDTAIIRFLYNDMNDIEGVACHTIEVNGKNIDVECLRKYNEPLHKCPLCEAGHPISAKLFIPVYDEGAKETKIWTRGKTFFQKLSSLCSRYNPLVATPFEVERCGKKGDTKTTYELYPMNSDKSIIEDFPEIKAEEVAYQVKSFEQLEIFLQTGTFGDEIEETRARKRQNVENERQMPVRGSENEVSRPVRRRPTYNDEENF